MAWCIRVTKRSRRSFKMRTELGKIDQQVAFQVQSFHRRTILKHLPYKLITEAFKRSRSFAIWDMKNKSESPRSQRLSRVNYSVHSVEIFSRQILSVSEAETLETLNGLLRGQKSTYGLSCVARPSLAGIFLYGQ